MNEEADMGENVDEAKGRAKEAVGDLTDNDRLKREGKVDRAGAEVKEKTDDAVDYIKVEIPTGNAERAAKLDAVEAVDVDGLIPLDDPRTDGIQQPEPQTPPGPGTPVRGGT